MNTADLNALWAELVGDVDLLDVWSSGSTLTDTLFPPERINPMYKHTVTFVSHQGKATVERDLSWYLDARDVIITSEQVVNPNARITNERLRAYHAKARAVGATTSKARHAFIKVALGHDVTVASNLTNAQFDKVMAAMDD